jgi:phage-related holin
MTVFGSFGKKCWKSTAEVSEFHTVNEMLARHSMCKKLYAC